MKLRCEKCNAQIKQGFPIDNKLYCTLLDEQGRCVPLRPKKSKGSQSLSKLR